MKAEAPKNGFDTTPKPAFLLAMQNQKWTVAGALSELVDNSFGPGRGNATRVHITHDPKHRTITVLDNGVGMESIGRLFQLGNTIGRSPGDIGLYGAGGTMAILWLASRVEVWTLRDGRVSHDAMCWADHIHAEKFPTVDATWRAATLANTPLELYELGHGTYIRLHLARSRTFHAPRVRFELARTYAPAIRQRRELLWTTLAKGGVDTQPLCDPLRVLEHAHKSVTFDLVVVTAADDHLPVHGVIGLVEELDHPQGHTGIAIGFGPRVITTTRECYTSPDGSERYSGTGVVGWLDLGEGWQPYLATTKDAINDQPTWDVLMAHVFEKIRPLLKENQHDRLSLELQDIAIMLQSALDGQAHVEVRARVEPPMEPDHDGDDGTRCGPSDPKKPKRTEDPDADDTKHKHGVTHLDVEAVRDAEIEGLLCRATVLGVDAIGVSVNGDHGVVQEALEARPINRKLLNQMVVEAIAREITDNPVLLKRMFPRRVLETLEERDERDRQGLIVRMLVDRIRQPLVPSPVPEKPATDEAAAA